MGQVSVKARMRRLFWRGYEPGLSRLGYLAALSQRAACGDFRNLWDAEFRIYSQNGEDGILNYLCECLDLDKPKCVELGAGNYEECNTRYLVEYRHGSALVVDARRDLVGHVNSLATAWRGTIVPIEGWITTETAPRYLEQAKAFFAGVDVVSLDIDGNDFWVAESLDLSGVSIVVVEYNPLFGGRYAVTVPKNDHFDRSEAHSSNLYYGASIGAFVWLMESRGFSFLGTNRMNNNAFFVARELRERVPLAMPSSDDLARFVDSRAREGRNSRGELTFALATQQLREIGNLPLVNVVTGEQRTVAESA